MEPIVIASSAVHYIWNVGKRRSLLCAPLVVDAIVEIMDRFRRASSDWKHVNCPKCLEEKRRRTC